MKEKNNQLKKSLGKFEPFSVQRGIDVTELKLEMHSLKQHFNKIDAYYSKQRKEFDPFLEKKQLEEVFSQILN